MDKARNIRMRTTLYFIGGIAGIIAVFLFRRNLSAEYYMLHAMGFFSAGPDTVPVTPEEWFALFGSRPVTALVLSNFFDAVNSVLVFLIMPALYVLLKPSGRLMSLLFLCTGAISALVYSLTSVSFPLFILSGRYSSGVSPGIQEQLIDAGRSLLAINNPALPGSGTGPSLAVFFLFFSGLVASILMLRSGSFRRWVGITGLIAHGAGLCFFPVLRLFPTLCFLPMTLSAPFIVTWYMCIAVKLLKLAKNISPRNARL